MKTSAAIAGLLVLGLVCEGLDAKSFSKELKRRTSRSEEHDEDTHGYGEIIATSSCVVSSHMLTQEFSKLAVKRMFVSPTGELCTFDEEDHHDEGGENETEFCEGTFHFLEELLLRLNVTSPCCLGLNNETNCEDSSVPLGPRRTSTAHAFGYGFLMVLLVSLASLVGLFLLPFTRNNRLKKYYQYIYGFLIAMGASALFCDAVLHLIPEAFGLHEETESGHSDHEDSDKLVIWRSCVIIFGLYAFFVFEFILHSWNTHSHSNEKEIDLNQFGMDEMETSPDHAEPTLLKEQNNGPASNGNEVTFPHSKCIRDGKEISSGIIHPIREDACNMKPSACQKRRFGQYILGIKPLAWLIIIGDGIHNFADGLALGAAISQSLSLGISTTIALIFHEIPHELGDFVILLSTGMSWYGAIFFNFISALTAFVGFFVGVGIGTNESEANDWILAITAGVFLYIALVDLIPELIHTKEKSYKRVLLFVMIFLGFLVSFVAMFLLALYEDQLDSLITI